MFRRVKIFLVGLFLACQAVSLQAQEIRFLSTQLVPISEATVLQSSLLRDLEVPVTFEPVDDRAVFLQQATILSRKEASSLVYGGLTQDFSLLQEHGLLGAIDRSAFSTSVPVLGPSYLRDARLGTDRLYFVPWMRATYLMVANKRALAYLPPGSNLNHLTYAEFLEWARNMYRATGAEKLGFPAAPSGLMPRFLEGFLYPSFTGSVTTKFDSPMALEMWNYLGQLWSYVSPSSFAFSRMDQPLMDGQVWVGWDHIARLVRLFSQAPDRFVAFPAPIGPQGRGYLSFLAGLGVPKGGPSAAQRRLIEYLTSPKIQAATLRLLGFLPVTSIRDVASLPRGLIDVVNAAQRQESDSHSLEADLPPLPQDLSREFNLVYMVAFSRIVLRGAEKAPVLKEQSERLRALLRTAQEPSVAGTGLQPKGRSQ